MNKRKINKIDKDNYTYESWVEQHDSVNMLVDGQDYWNIDTIDNLDCQYNLIYSERGGGKTTAVFWKIIKHFIDTDGQRAGFLIKRDAEDLKMKFTAEMLDNIAEMGWIDSYTNGEYDHCVYYSGKWYLASFNEETNRSVKHPEPFMYTAALSTAKRNKGAQYPNVDNIVYDEFILPAYDTYLDDETGRFLHLMSTIIRSREDVKVWLLGNTVSKVNPYFTNWGLYKAKEQEKHTIDIYQYNVKRKDGSDAILRLGLEYYAGTTGKASDVMFMGFGNISAASQIINGDYEIPSYSRPYKIKECDLKYTFYVEHDGLLFAGDLMKHNDDNITYINFRPSYKDEIKKNVIIYTQYHNLDMYALRSFTKPNDMPITQLISKLYLDDKITFATDETGAYITSYCYIMNNGHFTNNR